jgi:phenylalanine ammonia-lyase
MVYCAVQAVELRSKLLAGSYDARAVLSPATRLFYEAARSAALGAPDAQRPLHWNDTEEFIQPKIEGLINALQPEGAILRAVGAVRESLLQHAPA